MTTGPSMSQPVFCEDCLWCMPDRSLVSWLDGLFGVYSSLKYATCGHPNAMITAPQDYASRSIKPKTTRLDCSIKNFSGQCGDYQSKEKV